MVASSRWNCHAGAALALMGRVHTRLAAMASIAKETRRASMASLHLCGSSLIGAGTAGEYSPAYGSPARERPARRRVLKRMIKSMKTRSRGIDRPVAAVHFRRHSKSDNMRGKQILTTREADYDAGASHRAVCDCCRFAGRNASRHCAVVLFLSVVRNY